MSEKTSDQHLEDLNDLEATELNDSDLEGVAGGFALEDDDSSNNTNCGCNGGTPPGGSGNENCGC